MSLARPTPRQFATMLAERVLGERGFAVEAGACVRRDVFHRRLVVEFDAREREYYGRDVVQAFLLVDDDRCPAFTKTYGPVGLWLDVHRAVHHKEYAATERGWYAPDPAGGLPAQLVDDLERHGDALLNVPGTVPEMIDLVSDPGATPIRHGLSLGQLSGDLEARLLKALILARWTGDEQLVAQALSRVRAAAANAEGRRNLKLWAREYGKRPCVDVSGVR